MVIWLPSVAEMPPSVTSVNGYSYGKARKYDKSYDASAGNADTCLSKWTEIPSSVLHTHTHEHDLLIMVYNCR